MKILIVDDEVLTRNGLKTSIDWRAFAIDSIFEASNGKEGLRIAKKEKPDIIISDVRMPQMNGIDMVEQIRRILPSCSIIFMSGYSDKEYLMAAIKYKATRYVEKPLDLFEMEDAIRSAVTEVKHQVGETDQSSADKRLENQLVAALSHQMPPDHTALADICQELGIHFSSSCSFTVFILKFSEPLLLRQAEEAALIHEKIDHYIKKYNLEELHINKYDQHIIYFFYGIRPSSETMMRIARKVQTYYMPLGDCFLAIGKTCTGIEEAYHSYASAVILMQSSFFYDHGSIITDSDSDAITAGFTVQSSGDTFSELLLAKDRDGTGAFLARLLTQFRNQNSLLPNQVKDVYYKLFIDLQHAEKQMLISDLQGSDSILDYLDHAHTLTDLHELLVEKANAFFDHVSEVVPENPMIFSIKDFIHSNYRDENLSVKTISDHVLRSASYICTLFKSETDQTLNQYLTEYRLEKAKLLLADARYKISDISSKVGYADGNYFGKSFKKYTGLSPSEYREKILQ